MSNQVIPNEGEGVLFAAMTGKTAAVAWTLRLFTNNHTPINTDVMATYTEASGGGYAAFALTAANWVVTPGSPTVGVYPSHSFGFTGPLSGSATVYGYYITDANNKLITAQLLDTPLQPQVNGDTVIVNPQISFASLSGD